MHLRHPECSTLTVDLKRHSILFFFWCAGFLFFGDAMFESRMCCLRKMTWYDKAFGASSLPCTKCITFYSYNASHSTHTMYHFTTPQFPRINKNQNGSTECITYYSYTLPQQNSRGFKKIEWSDVLAQRSTLEVLNASHFTHTSNVLPNHHSCGVKKKTE